MCTCPSTTAMVIINVVINPQQTIISFTNTKLHNYELNAIHMEPTLICLKMYIKYGSEERRITNRVTIIR